MFSSRYVVMYTLGMALISSVSLALVVSGLKPVHDSNEAIFKKKEILASISEYLEKDPKLMSAEELNTLFETKVEKIVLDSKGQKVEGIDAESISMAAEEKKPESERKYPLFIYQGDKGKIYLMSVRGNGLWDKIWGTIAIEEDLNTLAGASFGHTGETPGLGAEIKDNPNFAKSLEGKKIYKGDDFVSVAVVKGGVSDPEHQIDGISGATITSVGVSNMLYNGIKPYLPYFNSNKKG